MKITTEWLKKNDACSGGLMWFEKNHQETDGKEIVKKLMKNHPDWANWLIVKMMTYAQYVSYAIYAAEQVIGIWEKKYPDDDRPRLAILAAKKCLEARSVNTARAAEAAEAAARAAYVASMAARAAYAARADGNAARAAARAAYVASMAAARAAEAAYVASMAAMADEAASAAYAARAAGNAVKAVYVASMADEAAYAARVARAAVAGNAKKTMYCKILNYGLKLL